MKLQLRILQLVFALSLTLAVTVVLTRAEQPRHLARGLAPADEITAAPKNVADTGDVSGTTVFLHRYGGGRNSGTDASFIGFSLPGIR